LRALTSQTVHPGPGCSAGPTPDLFSFEVVCALRASGRGRRAPRYRLSLSVRADRVDVAPVGLRGVVYGGPGEDSVGGAERIYGGIGDDSLIGTRVDGGPDDDFINGRFTESGAPNVLRGGTGDDIVSAWPAPGLVYGGPGWDQLRDSRRRDMLVGGPGHDEIDLLYANDSSLDVVRVRGGGRDFVDCHRAADRQDVFFVDPADLVEDECRSGRIVLTGRPRYVR
jgi:hypothetical protein